MQTTHQYITELAPRMDIRRKHKKPDFFKIEVPVKKKKTDEEQKKKAEHPSEVASRPLRRIVPYENLLVWGKFRGLGWWPGRIADRIELSGPIDPEDDPTRWVNWFGDHKYTETHVDNIAAFHEFCRFFLPKKFKRNIAYHNAVTEALEEACKRSGNNFDDTENLVLWAMQDFLPGGYLRLLPEIKEDVKLSHMEMDQKSLSKNIKALDVESHNYNESEFMQRRNMALLHVHAGRLNIQDMCLGCGDQDVKSQHPCFEGGLCKACRTDYMECMYSTDNLGDTLYCCICSGGQEVVYCDEETCGKCFCTDCIKELAGIRNMKQELKNAWKCYLCRERPRHGLLIRREDWRALMQGFFSNSSDVVYATLCPSFANAEKNRIKVLSLFDGISAGMVALKELNFDVEVYYASEIDQSALYISRAHHPEIYHVGDVRKINNKELMDWGPFDLLIGGSPCNDLAIVNPARKGLWSDEGSGSLFFEYFRIMNACSIMAAVQQRPFFWLFENVVHMDQDTKAAITRFLQRSPVLLDAKIVSPAKRRRLFWGNLPGMHRPLTPVTGNKLTLQECMEPGRIALTTKIGTITTNADTVSNKAVHDKFPVMDASQKQKDLLWVTEIERVFGLPDHYTDKSNLSSTSRRKVLGRTWSVPVIRHLFAPLRDLFLADGQ